MTRICLTDRHRLPVEERARWLLEFLLDQELDGYERSIKWSPELLLDQRFLGGIAAERLRRTDLLGICNRLGMPSELVEAVGREGHPEVIHFGYEGGADQDVFKVYLEYSRPAVARLGSGEESFVLHRAFKWDARVPQRHALATYRCFPGLDSHHIRQRIAAITAQTIGNQVIGEILDVALPHCSSIPMYLEVSEAGNPRASFDLNLHAATMPISSIHKLLEGFSETLQIPQEKALHALQIIDDKILGHLSGGISRNGTEFLTLYYDPFA